MSYVTEQKIRDLCSKAVATDDPNESTVAVQELKKALHQHLSEVREKVADLAVVIAVRERIKRSLQ